MLTEEDIAALRKWARENGDAEHAAVELLAEHDFWLWDEDFTVACTGRTPGGTVYMDFRAAARFLDGGPACSTSQGMILRAAADIGSHRWGVGSMDGRNRARLVRAVEMATGVHRG